MKIYGFVAPKQSGKTTACDYLVANYGAVKVSFKDALIAELKEKFPLLLEEIAIECGCVTEGGFDIDKLFQDKPPLIRRLMQEYGTNVRRGDDDNYWVKAWSKKVKEVWEEKYFDSVVVVDDVRFLNEAKEIKMWAGTLIRLTRTDMTNTDTHKSEQEQKDILCDYEITCVGGDQDHLYKELDRILNENK